MRFGLTNKNTICKFFSSSSWKGKGENLETFDIGDVRTDTEPYEENTDFYVTFVYKRYNEEKLEWSEKADRILYRW